LNDVPHQSALAADFIDRLKCYVTDVVIAETVYVMEKVYRIERQRIYELFSSFFKLETIAYNELLISQVFGKYLESRALSFVDCYSAVEAFFYGKELATFDKALLRKGGEHVKEPK
jgi:predicted nucleic-acid-binding protein